MIITAMG